jgi:hypothetical protein
MSEAKNDTTLQAKIDGYNSQYGKIVTAYIPASGETFCFRRPTRAEITHYNKVAREQQNMAVEHAIGLCRSCHVGPGEKPQLEQAFNDYALAFAGMSDFDGVSDQLLKLSVGEAAITVK